MRASKQQGILRGLRVLVVEDQYLVAEDMRRAVLKLGGEVIGPIGELGAAVAASKRETPDLALLDINLHEQMVYDLARALHEQDVPVIFATGYGEPDIQPDFSAVPRLEKPVTSEALAAAARLLGRRP